MYHSIARNSTDPRFRSPHTIAEALPRHPAFSSILTRFWQAPPFLLSRMMHRLTQVPQFEAQKKIPR